MCDLCSIDPKVKKNAREGTQLRAMQCERMGGILRDLASGYSNPHDDRNGAAVCARALIRYLVEEWL